MSYINRKKLETIDKPVIAKVDCPEWDGHVYMRKIKASELLKYYETQNPAVFLSYVLCDQHGKPEYTQSPEDIDFLDSKNGKVVTRLFVEALKISELNEDSDKDREDFSSPNPPAPSE